MRSPPVLPLVAAAALTACSGAAPQGTPSAKGAPALASSPGSGPTRIEIRRIDDRPQLVLVARDGDPAAAIVASVVTDLDPVATTILAAVVESRLRAAGFEVDVRVDRSAFRARILLPDAGRAPSFLGAVASAFARPIAAGGPDLALAAQRLTSLKRNPLDAPELGPIAACTGALGIAGSEPLPDLTRAEGARAAEAFRSTALTVGHTAIAVVGPASFCAAAAAALERADGFPKGPAAADAWPVGDAFGAYASPSLDRRSARVTVAVRVADPNAAAAAAERLGAPDSPLMTRLKALPEPFRLVEVTGVARPRGGCVSAVVEATGRPPEAPVEPPAALAAALVREEIAAELAGPSGGAVATRQILTATDPREAASRAAWWSLAAASPGSPDRWAFALGLPANDASLSARPQAATSNDPARQRFQAEIERALAGRAAAIAERRAAVERGQGELRLLLASTCGVAEEGTEDAGQSAVATVAALSAPRSAGVTIEPWITADGVGVIARASLRDEGEAPADLARRVADAAGRALSATPLTGDLVYAGRSLVLDLLERTDGRHGAAMSVFAGALAPDHPSWVEPFGLFSKVAGSGIEGARIRRRALAEGPLRVAVIANVDAAQAEAAASAVDRWLRPSLGPRVCRAGAPQPSRPGQYEARLPSDAQLAQALVGAPIPAPGAAGRDLAELAAELLTGDTGLLAAALKQAPATASARILGGARAPALVIDVRAPEAGLASAVAEVKALVARLSTSVTEADLGRAYAAVERREREGRADPRRRLLDLWLGRRGGPPPKPTLAALRGFLGEALKESALVVALAKPE